MTYTKGIIEINDESNASKSSSDNAGWWLGLILQHIAMDTDDLPFEIRTATRIKGTGRKGRVNPAQILCVDIIGQDAAVQKTKKAINLAVQKVITCFIAPPPIFPAEWHDIISDNSSPTELTRYGSNGSND